MLGDTGGRRGGSGGVRGDVDGSVIGEDGGNNSGSKRNKDGSVRRKGREGEEKARTLCQVVMDPTTLGCEVYPLMLSEIKTIIAFIQEKWKLTRDERSER
uniref:Uncharacterized protein n=1 Tax=Solanum tuberosum TaxID=4113 RepID=M1DNI9_SOLTU